MKRHRKGRQEASGSQQAEETVRSLALRQEAILAAVPDIIMEVDNNKVYTWANQAGLEFFGPDVIGKDAAHYFEGDQDTYATVQGLFDGSKDVVYVESWQRRCDGHKRLLAWLCRTLRDPAGRIIGALSSAHDITDRRLLEEQLRQAQKMEAIGRLAGGIAHDFNNQLTVIMGYCDLLLASPAGDSVPPSGMQEIQEIRRAAERAQQITGQLLAFGRKQLLRPHVVNLNDLVASMRNPLGRMIGEDVQLSVVTDPVLGNAVVDPTQVQQAVMNLVINARDAMPQGGKLTVETANVELGPRESSRHPGLAPGSYVMLAVSDTGEGMDQQMRESLFDPFFTTKPPGKGTGLGLAMVYGFVKQSGGTIYVYSEPGRGTTIKILLPRAFEPAEVTEQPAPPAPAPGGTETILVAEDEPMVRQVLVRVLRGQGYTVLEAGGSPEALSLGGQYDGHIHLLIADVVMPTMSGPELAKRLRIARPDMQVLFVSGYTEAAATRNGLLAPGVNLLSKPFGPDELRRMVRRLLDQPVTT